MTDLVRRALLGDRQAQEECTRHGIVLPCPFCGGKAEKDHILKKIFFDSDEHPSDGHYTYCTGIDCPFFGSYSRYYRTEQEAILAWNTRHAPPIGRCKDCAKWVGKQADTRAMCSHCGGKTGCDDSCNHYEPRHPDAT